MDKKVHWDVLSTINKRSWPHLPVSTRLSAIDKKERMCRVRLIIVFDNLCQVLHVCSLKKETIGMWHVRLIIFPANIYLFQHVCRLRIRKYWDVSSAIDNSSWQFLQTQTFLQARDKNVLRCNKVRVISVPDHTYQFQHVYSLGISRESMRMCQVRLISVNSCPYLPISTCLQIWN